MNCQDFQNNIDGLARGALLDTRTREVALAHESSCALCAARLADERAITSGLRVLAADTKDLEAPARVEAALIAALRARTASPVAAYEMAFADNAATRQWSWTKALVVASMAAAAALALFMLIPPGMPGTKAVVSGNQTAELKRDATPSIAESLTTKEETRSPQDNEAVQIAPPQTAAAYSGVARTARRAVRATPAGIGANGARGNTQARQNFTEMASNEEITTDFIPLMQGGRLTQGEGSHLVRVELPRSALERFGLPVNAEHEGGRVKADVLLGEDGLARAIRFVR